MQTLVKLITLLPEAQRFKILFRLGMRDIPMMGYVRPRLVALSPESVVVRIDCFRRTKNTYKSLFLGAIAVGGDCVAGFSSVSVGKDHAQPGGPRRRCAIKPRSATGAY